MRFIADLHIHSKYARAVSPKMTLPELDRWADDKGILVMGTGDFTHPDWYKQLLEQLEPAEPGLFRLKKSFKLPTIKGTKADTRFLLTAEISSIYTRAEKGRRIHTLLFAPDLETVKKINDKITSLGGNLRSDGRPIVGLDVREIAKIVLEINPEVAVVPAHCVLPDTLVHTKESFLTPIKNIKKGDHVLTHNNRWRKVQEIITHGHTGKLYKIQPYYFRGGLSSTAEHPFYAIKTKKNCHWSKGICKPSHKDDPECRDKYYKNYQPAWIKAEDLERGDILIYPRFKGAFANHGIIMMKDTLKLPNLFFKDGRVKIARTRSLPIHSSIPLTKEFCRLMGYYLAEGYTNGVNARGAIGFTFRRDEVEYIDEVVSSMRDILGFSGKPIFRELGENGTEITFHSKLLYEFFANTFYGEAKRHIAATKSMPYWALGLRPEFQVEILRGWWRGDTGYTVSRTLMNQMKVVMLRLGILPSIREDAPEKHKWRGKHQYDGRVITARSTLYHFNHLTFFEDQFHLLDDPEFKRFNSRRPQRYGWLDDQYVYLPIRDINSENFNGEVFNLEVEDDNSYVTEFAVVHNCWTPWFSIFGSMSGFNSIEECFGEYSKYIFAAETGLSSDPLMNWRLSALDHIALISNSDSHSLERIGREANIFETELSYTGIISALKNAASVPRQSASSQRQSAVATFVATLEYFPEEGKYHYDGHLKCGVSWSPKETRAHRGICSQCGKPVVVGVLNRLDKLADRSEEDVLNEVSEVSVGELKGKKFRNRPAFINLVTLDSIIGEAFDVGQKSKSVKKEYDELIKQFGSEFAILTRIPFEELKKATKPEVAEGIRRMRLGEITVTPGYDGEYGIVKIFNSAERKKIEKKQTLF